MISRLHYITQDIPGVTHAELAEFACCAGVDWVQLRVKGRPAEEWLEIARETRGVCGKYGARFIVNDSVDVARASGADGVHLGREDLPLLEARRILGADFLIGATANTADEVVRAAEDGADYVGLGPFRFTSTKQKLSPILGLEGVRSVLQELRGRGCAIPVVVIGGILPGDVADLIHAGAHGVAVSSGINLAADRIESARHYLNSFEALLWKH